MPLLNTKVTRYPTSLVSYKVIDAVSNGVTIPVTKPCLAVLVSTLVCVGIKSAYS